MKKSRRADKRCYVCGAAATSADHVPPRMVFPEFKDCGVDYRENLVTVPACPKHNEQMSEDDTYFCCVMTAQEATNQIGLDHFNAKITRTLRHTPGLLETVFAELRPVRVPEGRMGAYRVDRARYDRVAHKITAGVYHHLTSFRLPDWSIMTVTSPALRYATNLQAPFAGLFDRYEGAPQWREFRSGHPDVYRCRYIIAEERVRHFAFEHVFYGGAKVWVTADPGDALYLPKGTIVRPPTGRRR